MLCRDARDGFDKLSSEARKQSLEGARRRWEGSIALALSLQAPVTPVLPQSASSSSGSSAASAHFPIDSSVAAASGSYEAPYAPLMSSPSAFTVGQSEMDLVREVGGSDFLSRPIKTEGASDSANATIDHACMKGVKKENSSSSGASSIRLAEPLYPAITMKLEDMPVSACRVVNPFSR